MKSIEQLLVGLRNLCRFNRNLPSVILRRISWSEESYVWTALRFTGDFALHYNRIIIIKKVVQRYQKGLLQVFTTALRILLHFRSIFVRSSTTT